MGSETVQHEVWRIQNKWGCNMTMDPISLVTPWQIIKFYTVTFCGSTVGVLKMDGWFLASRPWLQDQWGSKEASEARILAGKWLRGCLAEPNLKMNGSQMRNADRLREKKKVGRLKIFRQTRCSDYRDWKIQNSSERMKYMAFSILGKEW